MTEVRGRIRVYVIEASKPLVTSISGKVDCYSVIYLGSQKNKTKVSSDKTNPKWNEEFTFENVTEEDFLYVEVYDRNLFWSDTFLGFTIVPFVDMLPDQDSNSHSKWYPLYLKKKDSPSSSSLSSSSSSSSSSSTPSSSNTIPSTIPKSNNPSSSSLSPSPQSTPLFSNTPSSPRSLSNSSSDSFGGASSFDFSNTENSIGSHTTSESHSIVPTLSTPAFRIIEEFDHPKPKPTTTHPSLTNDEIEQYSNTHHGLTSGSPSKSTSLSSSPSSAHSYSTKREVIVQTGTHILIRVRYWLSEEKIGPEDFELLNLIGKGKFGTVIQVRKITKSATHNYVKNYNSQKNNDGTDEKDEIKEVDEYQKIMEKFERRNSLNNNPYKNIYSQPQTGNEIGNQRWNYNHHLNHNLNHQHYYHYYQNHDILQNLYIPQNGRVNMKTQSQEYPPNRLNNDEGDHQDIQNEEIYAMKIIRKKNITKIKNIRSEITILKTLTHPFIVSLQFAFQDPHNLYFVLEYVPGGDLYFHLRKEGNFTVERTKFYSAMITLSLEHLHNLGIIYRDLKPENVLLDEKGYIKLTDFGLSKILENPDDRATTVCGTSFYLAPEVVLRMDYNKEIDWWSLGIMTYEMVVGLPPFNAENKLVLFQKITNEEPKISRHIPAPAAEFISSLLRKTSNERLGSGEEDGRAVRKHRFFDGMDWHSLFKKEMKPPFVPTIRSMEDTSHFSTAYTAQKPKLRESSTERASQYFDDFSFVKESVTHCTHPNL